MAKRKFALTPSTVKNARGGASVHPVSGEAVDPAKPYKLHDGAGLYLLVQPGGGKWWRFDYRRPVTSKQNTLSLGVFPAVSLAAARESHAKARTLLSAGIDPAAAKVESKAAAKRVVDATFDKVAADWLEYKSKDWADETRRKAKYVIDAYLSPVLAVHSIDQLDVSHCLPVLVDMPPSMIRKARQYLGGIARHGIRLGLRAKGHLLIFDRDDLPKYKGGHIPAATTAVALREVLVAVAGYPIPVQRAAMQMSLLTAQRPGNIASMQWRHIDAAASEWLLPAAVMKKDFAHTVPMSRQALAVLDEMRAYTGGKNYVFPPLAQQGTPHLHRDSISLAFRKLGLQGKHTTHGARAALRTVAREKLGIDLDVLEAQLAHAKKGEVAAAYDRTQFIEQRHKVMQVWADYLDTLREGGKVVAFKTAAGSVG